ncbi:hypothetical protein [Mycobacterium colombiense]|uniref:hypothetical protein n=1 Tax=Mycobacterium colombiense TaxID=339268 RepID=UPI00200AB7FE|nr:hypothetical protein [Mycobacterium colombiense]MCK8644402.1 hypothetical protein [Mycobacterium colombiense]
MNFLPGTLTAPPINIAAVKHGWRIYRLDRYGLLWPPFASLGGHATEPLSPLNGAAVAACPHGYTPAALECDCGLYFWPLAHDLLRAVRATEIAGSCWGVITFGEVAGPFQPDRTFYDLDNRDMFRGFRGHCYRVLVAIATTDLPLYDFPVIRYTDRLPDLSATAGEYAA